MVAEHSLEIERKYDVDDDTPLPDWSALPGVVAVGEPEPRSLDATYFDTVDGALARAATAVRRREGGPDSGWHVKRATPDGKLETRWPLTIDAGQHGGSAGPVPAEVVAEVASVAAPPFAPIARVRNQRLAYALVDADGELVAEFVDDRVVADDLGASQQTRWREWELELGPRGPEGESARAAFFRAADALVIAAGGRVSSSSSKLGRALGR